MKKFPASNYVSPGRQNEPLDRRIFNVEAHGDKIVRATIQSFSTEEQDLVKANLNITGVVRYDVAQELTDVQAEQARANIWANSQDFPSMLELQKFNASTHAYVQGSVYPSRTPGDDVLNDTTAPSMHMYCYSTGSDDDPLVVYTPTLRIAFNTHKDSSGPVYPPTGTPLYQKQNNNWVNINENPATDGYLYCIRRVSLPE